MKIRAYPVLCRAVEEGVAYGARKRIDTPDAETIEEQIVTAVRGEPYDSGAIRDLPWVPRAIRTVTGSVRRVRQVRCGRQVCYTCFRHPTPR